MTDFLDGLERELTSAARRRARGNRPARELAARLRRPLAAARGDLRALADGAVVALALGAVVVVAAVALAADHRHRTLPHAPATGRGAVPASDGLLTARPCAGDARAVALRLGAVGAPASLRALLRGDPRAAAGDRRRAVDAVRARAGAGVAFAGDVRAVEVRAGLTVWLVPVRRCHPSRADVLFAVARAGRRTTVVELGSARTIARAGGGAGAGAGATVVAGGGRRYALMMTPAGAVSVRCPGHAPYPVVHRLVAFAGAARCHLETARA